MPRVWIPPLLRDLTGDCELLIVPGASVAELIEALDQEYPGVKSRLCPGGELRPGLAVIIDSEVGRLGLLERVGPTSEVHFLPAIAGGSCQLA
jgi:molybdopterin synthase sulfur carrier subunit